MEKNDHENRGENEPFHERAERHSRRIIKYFENLANNPEQQQSKQAFEWYLGLYLSKKLLQYIENETQDLSELELFVKILETDRLNRGFGWADLYWTSKHYLDHLKNQSSYY